MAGGAAGRWGIVLRTPSCVLRAHPALWPSLAPRPLQSASVYSKLRLERMNARLAGIRAKRAKEAEADNKE